jgi:hypothetical protein
MINVTTYGAVGDGHTDNSAAIASAIAAAGGQNTLYFPAGTYYCSSGISVTNQLLFFTGDGPGISVLQFAAGANGITINNGGLAQGPSGIRSLDLVTLGSDQGTAVSFSAGSGLALTFLMEDAQVTGATFGDSWQNGISLNGASNSSLENVLLRGNTSDRTKMTNGLSLANQCENVRVRSCTFSFLMYGISVDGQGGTAAEGLVATDNVFLIVEIGVWVRNNTGDYFDVSHNYVDFFSRGIVLGTAGVNGSNESQINHNYLDKDGSSTEYGVGIESYGGNTAIIGNEATARGVNRDGNGINLGAVSWCRLSGNLVYGWNASGAGIALTSGSSNNVVTGNVAYDNTTGYYDVGTGNLVVNNIG